MPQCLMILFLLLMAPLGAAAGEIAPLADCTARVFQQIGSARQWSGTLPSACRGSVIVEERPSGIFVTAWSVRPAPGGWTRNAFSGALALAELESKPGRTAALQDLQARARRLERCLDSILADNDPLECRDRAVKSYQAGETSGTEISRLVWLEDGGRHAVVGHAFGNASATPSPPAELLSGSALLPGVIIDRRPPHRKR